MTAPKAWIAFFEESVPKRLKTKQWTVVPNRDKEDPRADASYVELGLVKWYAPWRRYCFFPGAGALFDTACLEEIALFCREQTELQRRRRA